MPLARSRSEAILALALFFSGAAALVNQAVWQRSLGIYLAGCEAISSLVVVLVFMLGLGFGSLYVGRRSERLANPARLLMQVELGLCAINLGIAYLLSRDIAQSVYAFQQTALSLGLPLRVVYALCATLVLFVPCFLMGTTFPLASEACQRQLGESDSHRLPLLVFLNTLGAVLGAAASGFYLMPFLGQTLSLVVGASLNGLAGLTVLAMVRAGNLSGRAANLCRERPPWRSATDHSSTESRTPGTPRRAFPTEQDKQQPAAPSSIPAVSQRPEFVLAFLLGLLSLGYEMYLFRVVTLAHEPRPYNFSTVLLYFLLFWSIGVALAKRIDRGTVFWLAASALAVAGTSLFHLVDRYALRPTLGPFTVLASAAVYALPCILFGLVFGQVLSRAARSWGRDVGWFYALNTVGSSAGILLTVLVGYEFDPFFTTLAIALGYLGCGAYYWRVLARRREGEDEGVRAILRRSAVLATAAATVALLIARIGREHIPSHGPQVSYFGRDGVIEIDGQGNMGWDGLWHSELSRDENHIGTNNWALAAVPLVCHDDGPVDDTLVIGLGTGITAATLARSDRVGHVDVYEINHTIKPVLRDYPDGTLHVADDPKIDIFWQDGRSGLALAGRQYDLITQQPLYLRQSGSGILLSREYFELVKRHLKPGGVFCIYCNPHVDSQLRDVVDTAAMAAVVRRTAAEVFPYCESFFGGYMLIVSNEPLDASEQAIRRRLGDDRLSDEVRRYGVPQLAGSLDQPKLAWESPHRVTDNHPVVEYFELREVLESVFGGKRMRD